MKNPKEKYLHDPEYHNLVNLLESFIDQARFTPSEMREACILACINYEMRHVRSRTIELDPRVCNAIDILDNFVSKQHSRRQR